jgi:hypothetical protein
MDTLVKSCNHYGKSLTAQSRPKTRYSRATINKDTDKNELNKFLGLCLLQGQVRFPSIIKAFSHKPLYYHPLFKATMSGRRFKQLLRCFSCSSGDKNIGKHRLFGIYLVCFYKNFNRLFIPTNNFRWMNLYFCIVED